jgi:predicted SAM-dependent methyltransferase
MSANAPEAAESRAVSNTASLTAKVGVLLDENPILWKQYMRVMRLVRTPGQRSRVKEYLEQHDRRRLLIGAGSYTREGWLCTDVRHDPRVMFMDATVWFPLPTAAFDVVQCEHMIEHIPYSSAKAMLGECRRVLRDGGVIRIATPDLRQVVALLQVEDETSRAYIEWANRFSGYSADGELGNPAITVNRMMQEFGHQFIYDEATLTGLLEAAGFTDVAVRQPGKSPIDDLQNVERHGELIGETFNQIETMVLEARVPEDNANGGRGLPQ